MALYFYSMQILFIPKKKFIFNEKRLLPYLSGGRCGGLYVCVLLSMVPQPRLLKLPQKANCEGTGQKTEKAICEMNEAEIGFWS